MKIINSAIISNNINIITNNEYLQKKQPSQNINYQIFSEEKAQYANFSNINFKSYRLPAELINDLKKLNGIPCPCCGTKMFNKEGLDAVLKEIKNIKTTNEFINTANNLTSYINDNFADFINEIKTKAAENPELSCEKFLENMSKYFEEKSDAQVEILQTKLTELLKSDERTEEEKNSISNALKKIKYMSLNVHRRSFYKHTSYAIKDCLASFPEEKRFELYKDLNKDLKKAFLQEYIIRPADGNESTLAQNFFHNLLSYSKADIHKIIEKYSLTEENLILNCNHCNYTGKTLYSKANAPQNYYNYIYATSKEALNGNIPSQKNYPLLVLSYVKKYSKNRLIPHFSQADLFKLSKEPDVKKIEISDFPIVHHPGIYCASCGQKTITHEERTVIFQQISQANSPLELLEILNEHKEIIKPKFNRILEEFNSKMDTYPLYNETKIIKKLKHIAHADVNKNITQNIEYIKNIIKNDNDLTKKEKIALDIFAKYLEQSLGNSAAHKLFSADFYKKNFDDLMKEFNENPKMQEKLWYDVFAPAKTAFSVQKALFPQQEIIMRVGGTLKTITENIISRSLATIDHLNPKTKYYSSNEAEQYSKFQSNQKYNLAVMCKECNTNKGSRELSDWMAQHPEVKDNLKKYLAQVQELQKKGIFDKEFLLYSYGVKAQVKRISGIEL